MSKRFYVLYTLKEFYLPRIYKTKATVNKYIEENNKLEFKLFAKEEDAQLFSKSIEGKLEKKFKIKMVEYLQKSHREIEEINEKSAERRAEEEGGTGGNGEERADMKEIERKEKERKEERGEEVLQQQKQQQKIQIKEAETVQEKVEVKNETQSQITMKPKQIIQANPPQKQVDSTIQAKKQQHQTQQAVIDQVKEVIEQLKTEMKEQMIALAMEKSKEEVKQEVTAKEEQKQQIVKHETPLQIIHQPSVIAQVNHQDKAQASKQAIQEVRKLLKEQAKVQSEQETNEESKEQLKVEVKQQASQLISQETREQPEEQIKEEVKISAEENVKKSPQQQVVIITKEAQIIQEQINSIPIQQETLPFFPRTPPFSYIQNLPLNHLFYPLSPKYLSFLYPKVIKYYNFPSICNLLRFHHLQNTYAQSQQISSPLTLNISLIFKQNPGLSLVILDIQSPSFPKEVSYLKTVVLGVKAKEEAKVLALIQGLRYASTFGKDYQLTINSNFPTIKNQQKSLDARVRCLFSQYMTQQLSFSRVSYV